MASRRHYHALALSALPWGPNAGENKGFPGRLVLSTSGVLRHLLFWQKAASAVLCINLPCLCLSPAAFDLPPEGKTSQLVALDL